MADILPFRGLRYSPRRIADFNQVVSPPYDVIDGQLQEHLYQLSPYNVVRLDYGKTLPGDDEGENRYTRAARTLGEWLREGVLVEDRDCCIYYLEEEYEGEFGERKTRKGFVATVRLEDPGSGMYLPHEKTLEGPKADRLKLTEACRANLSPIFSLYDDPGFTVQRDLETIPLAQEALVAVDSGAGNITRLWKVSEPGVIRGVMAAMHLKSFFIADGHHRYETALTYRDLMRRANPAHTGREPWNYVMMYFSNLRAPGLTVFPTHRTVHGLADFDVRGVLDRAREYFDVEPISGGDGELLARMRELRGRQHAFGVATKGGKLPWLLVLRDDRVMNRLLSGRAPKVLRTLDVTILHSLLLEKILGIDETAQARQLNLRYVKGSRELLRAVREDPEVQAGFLLNPTRIEEVKAVAEEGERMPQKSTFFYPKLVTGLVMNPLFDAPEACRV